MHLALFFTRRTSLSVWHDIGLLDRELALYRRLASRCRVTLVTYGGKRDQELASSLPEFTVLCNQLGLPRRVYERFLHRLHGAALRNVTAIKTNQMNGAQIAQRCATIFGVPLIARSGYDWSATEAKNHGNDSRLAREARRVEEAVYPQATRIVVTTSQAAADLRERFPGCANAVCTIPNYVDTDLFRPGPSVPTEFDVVYVGRLSAEKNISQLLTAITNSPYRLLVIGGGNEQPVWQTRFPSHRITWLPRVPHPELPTHLRRAPVFVLPSLYEGHPKAIIEAMACGRCVVGSDVPGIRSIVEHLKNGILSGTDAADIRSGLDLAFSDQRRLQQLGHAARQCVLDRFSLDYIARQELKLLEDVHESSNRFDHRRAA